MKIAIQCSSLGERCGIATYTSRLNHYLNELEDVESKCFIDNIKNTPDIINIQYEPGLMSPMKLQEFVNRYNQPIVVTAHHMGHLPNFYPMIDGIVIHSRSQIDGLEEPWSYKVIPHPALVFPNKDKGKLRKKYGLPENKKIIGTAGFIAGTGKQLPEIVEFLLKDMNDNEYLYFITSFWKGGDFGFKEEILKKVKDYGKESQFRLDGDFVSEETLNEKMQCCDLLFAWNKFEAAGSTSGIAMDMIGARRKLIVKDSPHYNFVGSIKGVERGNREKRLFSRDVFRTLRSSNLDCVADPEPYSWEVLTKDYAEYFREIAGL